MKIPEVATVSETLSEVYASVTSQHDAIRAKLQRVISAMKFSEDLDLRAGQEIARRINELVVRFGFRFQMLRGIGAATLSYKRLGGERCKPVFVLQATECINRSTRSVGHVLSELQLIAVPKRKIPRKSK